MHPCADILTTAKRQTIPFLLRYVGPYAPVCERGQIQKFAFKIKAHELAYRPIRLYMRMYNDDNSYPSLQ